MIINYNNNDNNDDDDDDDDADNNNDNNRDSVLRRDIWFSVEKCPFPLC